jgi:glutathione peroxidase-family protein
MHAFLLLVSLFASRGATEDSSFYGIRYQTIGGIIMNTASLKGKKVIVVVMPFSGKNLPTLNYLDSVQRANSNLQVLAVPSNDFGETAKIGDLLQLQKQVKLIITQPLNVKRSVGGQQHPVFSWLTKVTGNKHFDSDADEAGKIFIISESGTLYSVLPSTTPLSVLRSIIIQNFKE